VKIIDFGLARKFEPLKKLQILFGTPEFVAPEVVNFEPIGYSTDMWALGVITYVLVSGLSPFMGDTDLETMANVTIAEYDYEDDAFNNVSNEAKDFIDSLLVKNQVTRATADSCLNHPWLQQITSSQKKRDATALTLAKDNHAVQKTAWNNRDSNYYLFDSKSRTASQLYEMNLTFTPQKLEQMECAQSEDDQFNFLSPDSPDRQYSLLSVNCEKKKVSRDVSSDKRNSNTSNEGLRKRSLEEVRHSCKEGEATIEYIGLVKRSKTPLITVMDIQKQAQFLSERKQSACISLPDIVCSSVDVTEPETLRCSDLENDESSDDKTDLEDALDPYQTIDTGEDTNNDIVTIEDDTIQGSEILDRTDKHQLEFDEYPVINTAHPLAIPVIDYENNLVQGVVEKNYTVEDGFDRPEDGWDCLPSTNDNDYNVKSDDENENSSESSSLPSESSGIFYKAEYTPPLNIGSEAPPVNNTVSLEKGESYWREFFNRKLDSPLGASTGTIRYSPSGHGNNVKGLPPKPSSVSKSKSDAKISYKDVPSHVGIILSSFEEEESFYIDRRKYPYYKFEPFNNSDLNTNIYPGFNIKTDDNQSVVNLPDLTSNVILPRTLKPLKKDKFDKPWTELSANCPESEQLQSNDNISSTISQEMRNLLHNIQALGKTEQQPYQDNNNFIPKENSPRIVNNTEKPYEEYVDFDKLMKEVENQIRFSTTPELLERIAYCPAIENYETTAGLEVINVDQHNLAATPMMKPLISKQGEETTNNIKGVNLQSIPDLLKNTVNSHQEIDTFKCQGSLHFVGTPSNCPTPISSQTPSSVTFSSPEYNRRKYTSLPRPSDMPSAKTYQLTGRVPDMLSRIRCPSDSKWESDYEGQQNKYGEDNIKHANFTEVKEDLSKVRSDIDSLKEVISNAKNDIKANGKPLLDIFDEFKTKPADLKYKFGGSKHDKGAIVRDLADTSSAMRDIENTLKSFSKQVFMPIGKDNDSCQLEKLPSSSPRNIFRQANQGSVTKTKDKYEQRSLDYRIPLPLQSPKQKCSTPFSKTRSPSPAIEIKKNNYSRIPNWGDSLQSTDKIEKGKRMNLRNRSPSPVVTGKVSSFRNKFETIPMDTSRIDSSNIPRTYLLKSRESQTNVGKNSSQLFDSSPSRPPTISQESTATKTTSVLRDNSVSHLPTHLMPIQPVRRKYPPSFRSKPNIRRAQSLRPPDLTKSEPQTTGDRATRGALNCLIRCTLPA